MDNTVASIPLVGPGCAERISRAGARGRELVREQRAVTARNKRMANYPHLAHIAEYSYKLNVTDVLLGRYRVQGMLGYGSFGSVVRAEDVLTRDVVAVKVLHKRAGLHRDPRQETRVYDTLVAGCSPRTSLFAEVYGSGVHGDFDCTVFQLCAVTLCDVLKGHGGFTPLPSRHVCEISYQVVLGVEYLHSLNIIHADVKPDNIAFKNCDVRSVEILDASGKFRQKNILACTALCIIDLGSSVYTSRAVPTTAIIGAPLYRAPEVSLQIPWSIGVDTFAVGCVLAETHLNETLFHPDLYYDWEHLAMVDRIAGPFPRDFARAIERGRSGVFRLGSKVELIYPPANVRVQKDRLVAAMQRIKDTKSICARVHDTLLADLLKKLLMPDPSRRFSLAAAARHMYFAELGKGMRDSP
ncbi:hypothetical protein VTO73DRAFT_11658 [Trametes versicolor]